MCLFVCFIVLSSYCFIKFPIVTFSPVVYWYIWTLLTFVPSPPHTYSKPFGFRIFRVILDGSKNIKLEGKAK